MPIYKIEVTATSRVAGEKINQTRLVNAPNQARAVGHVIKDSVKVEPCSVNDAVALGAEGVKVEEAE
jgi:hypothetical protein